MLKKNLYGKLSDGREVFQFVFENKNGTILKVINFGATVTSIITHDKNGKLNDVVPGYDNLEGYENDQACLGSIVGRIGNRISKGQFNLEGESYQLYCNDGENHLHGGKIGFNKVLWDYKIIEGDKLELSYLSIDGEEYYPGNLNIVVTYSLSEKNELIINYKGKTDKTTILNPTNHTYFNLTGNFNETILDHQLQIEASQFTATTENLIPTGEIKNVKNTPLDFLKLKKIGLEINNENEQLKCGKGYDHNFVLGNYNGNIRKIATVIEENSRRKMDVYTDQPGVQLYTGNFLDVPNSRNGIHLQKRTGLCLETQCFPDAPNNSSFPSVVLHPSETYTQTTIYKFSVVDTD